MAIIADFEYLHGETCQAVATSDDDIAPWWVALVLFFICNVFSSIMKILCPNMIISTLSCQTFGGMSLLLCFMQLFRWKAVIPLVLYFAVYGFGQLIALQQLSYISGMKRDAIDLETSSKEALKPRNVYMDFSKPMELIYVTVILQVLLTVVYVLSVVNSSDGGMPCFNQPWAYTLMWFAILLRAFYYTLDNVYAVNNLFEDLTLWQTIRKVLEANNNKESNNDDKFMITWCTVLDSRKKKYNPESKREITKIEYYSRYLLHVFINAFVATILNFLMVIQSANGNFTDFVLNFVAAKFIIELDDYSTWNFESEFWIVKRSILEEQEKAQNDASVEAVENDEESGIQPIDSSAVEEEINQSKDSVGDEESNNPSDSSLLDKGSRNQTHTNIQEDLPQIQLLTSQEDQERALQVLTLTNEVHTLKNEVKSHKKDFETLKNDFQALLTSLQESDTSRHETMPKNSGSVETPSS